LNYFVKQSCGSSILADGRLADLIRRVATFGMVLMKLDVRQVYTTIATCACDFSGQILPNIYSQKA
jgi:phosphoenolpyruvate carboxylase